MKKVGTFWNKILASHYWKVGIMGVLSWLAVQFVDWKKEDNRVKERSKQIPVMYEQIHRGQKWQLRHDSIEVLEKIESKAIHDSAVYRDKEMMRLIKKIYRKVDISWEDYVEFHIKQHINENLHHPEMTEEKRRPETTERIYDPNLLEYIFKRDSCLVKK